MFFTELGPPGLTFPGTVLPDTVLPDTVLPYTDLSTPSHIVPFDNN